MRMLSQKQLKYIIKIVSNAYRQIIDFYNVPISTFSSRFDYPHFGYIVDFMASMLIWSWSVIGKKTRALL